MKSGIVSHVVVGGFAAAAAAVATWLALGGSPAAVAPAHAQTPPRAGLKQIDLMKSR